MFEEIMAIIVGLALGMAAFSYWKINKLEKDIDFIYVRLKDHSDCIRIDTEQIKNVQKYISTLQVAVEKLLGIKDIKEAGNEEQATDT